MPTVSLYNGFMAIQRVNRSRAAALHELLLSKAMPPNSLGRLTELALHLALIQEKPLDRCIMLLFASDHGITEEGVTNSPQEITYQQCCNFASGGGACSLFASLNNVDLKVIDVGVKHTFSSSDGVIDHKVAWGSNNFLKGPALEVDACHKAMQVGKQMVLDAHKAGYEVVGFGEMGVGNTTCSSALAAALLGIDVPKLTGKGSGLSDEELKHKIAVIEEALALHPQKDPFTVLCNLGGYEHAALCGAVLQAAELSLPILLDGFVVTSAALVAYHMEEAVQDYLIPCHLSAMSGHKAMLDAMGLVEPYLNLGMQLGEGTGVLCAWPLIRLASHILFDMTSFSEGKVTDSTALLKRLGVL
jgi:nicotinate-nucleotide--dimethylbenzimidazole phosphoribosyltransferase